MANDTQKSNNSNRFYIIVLAVLLCAGVYSAVRGCGNDTDIEQLYKSTDSAVGRIEAEHETAGRELDATSGQLDAAGAAVGRADELIDRSQERVGQNAASIADCQRIIINCQAILDDCQRIYREVEEANSAGAGSGSGS